MSRIKRTRDNQRQRTRAALVQAAVEAVQRGETPTIEAAAEAAQVSRATAYRYFASQQALILEVSLEAMWEITDPHMTDEKPVEERVDSAIRSLLRMAIDNERYLRTFLKYSMEQWLTTRKEGGESYPVRKGRRMELFTQALAPVQSLAPRQKRRLMTALAMLGGMEALVVAKDVCGCSAKEAEEASRWAARAILKAALEEARGEQS